MVLNTEPYNPLWKTYKINKIWASSDDFIRAKQKLKQAIELSETEDLNSEKDEYFSKYKRRILAAKKVKRLVEFSPNDNRHNAANKSKAISQTLPKHPFMKSPDDHTPKHFKNNISTSSINKSPKHRMHSNLINQSSPYLSTQLKRSQSNKNENGSENGSITVINNYNDLSASSLTENNNVVLSPSLLISPVTPPNSKINSVARNLFPSQSPAMQPKKVGYDKTSQLYVVTKLTEMNTKINKLVLDMSRQEELLKDVLKIVKFQDKSIDDNDDYGDDIFPEGFPIDDLDSLREINISLKNDDVFRKKLIKKLKCYHGSNIGKVTKSIMDLVFTNNLGRQVSLTGKGPMNKKEKEPLKSLFLFKIIINAILKNVKNSSVSSAHKAVSGWLKHAKERYERHIVNNSPIDNSQDS
ncbi:unnamed protein product [Macrosiphum euphorbiae]|uniref:DUF4806 domain-containing protein n=1 Tax=Macrosiphum euphorbiae TaxID=13131 RepID=A0AAV0Y4N2_9HEMI|nr:unnamed protein product [Macrosiphum euphorbiae]